MAVVPNAVEIVRKITTAGARCMSVTYRLQTDRRTGDSIIVNVNVNVR